MMRKANPQTPKANYGPELHQEKALAVIRAIEVIGEATVFQGSTTQPLNYSII